MPWEIVKVRDLTFNAETALAQVSKEQQDRIYSAAFRRAMERRAKRVAKVDIIAAIQDEE